MAQPPGVFGALVQRYAKVGLVLDKGGVEDVSRVCEVGKFYMQEQARDLVKNAGSAPLLVAYSSDGTRFQSKVRYEREVQGVRVTRVGGSSAEYLVRQTFLRSIAADGQAKTVVVLRDPLPLREGEGAWNLFSAGVSFLPTLRQLGHEGIAIQHYCFDRALFEPLSLRFAQQHSLLARQASAASSSSGGALGQSLGLQELLEWVVSCGCSVHDAHNSLKWGLYVQFSDTSLLKDIYIGIEALRNSYDLLQRFLGSWVSQVVRFVEQPVSAEVLAELWIALGISADMVEVLAHDLHLIWKDGFLEVDARLQGDSDLLEKVSGCLLYIWKWKSVCESRWCTVGTSCRVVVGGFLSGIQSLVSAIKKAPNTSTYYLNGFDRFTPDNLALVATAALAAYPSEALLMEILEDDRVLGRLLQLEECMQEEMQWLASISERA